MLGAPGFGDERRAAAPFATHAKAEEETKGGELWNRVRKTASRAGNGIDEDRSHESTSAANSISENAEAKSADRRGPQGERVEKAGGARAHVEFADQVREDKRVQHDVHGVEQPAQAAGNEGFALVGRSVPRPLERRRRTH